MARREQVSGIPRIARLMSVMESDTQKACPGCELRTATSATIPYGGYYNASSECWGLYTRVLEREFGNALLFGAAHQMTVDTYAVQHVGGSHPDKSIAVHLCGLYLVLEHKVRPPDAPRLLQRLASKVDVWPHFPPPTNMGLLTVQDVLNTDSVQEHIQAVEDWSRSVWDSWSNQRGALAEFLARRL